MDMDLLESSEHEQVVFCRDRSAGLRAIIAVHSTHLGPSLGGTRFYPFTSLDEALADVLRLSRAMTYKSSAAGLDLGGGKAVVIGDPHRDKTDILLDAYASFIDSLGGRYITTEDVGTTVGDMDRIKQTTRWVTGTSPSKGGSGDPSAATAWGVFSAIKALAGRLWGSDELSGRHVAIQGVGKVGSYIAEHLAEDGCKLTVADVTPAAVDRMVSELGATAAEPDTIHATECDIFAPCALGGALNEVTVPELRCQAVAGCANNQLSSPRDARTLAERGILYAPDFIVNAGGVINIAYELKEDGYDQELAFAHCWRVGETLNQVLDLAASEGVSPAAAADRLAESRLS
jgi:glutamate dehydrogenase/leucine dehydrogenase